MVHSKNKIRYHCTPDWQTLKSQTEPDVGEIAKPNTHPLIDIQSYTGTVLWKTVFNITE